MKSKVVRGVKGSKGSRTFVVKNSVKDDSIGSARAAGFLKDYSPEISVIWADPAACDVRSRTVYRKFSRVKTSWGANWGGDGYFRSSRGAGRQQGTCGICRKAVHPVRA